MISSLKYYFYAAFNCVLTSVVSLLSRLIGTIFYAFYVSAQPSAER